MSVINSDQIYINPKFIEDLAANKNLYVTIGYFTSYQLKPNETFLDAWNNTVRQEVSRTELKSWIDCDRLLIKITDINMSQYSYIYLSYSYYPDFDAPEGSSDPDDILLCVIPIHDSQSELDFEAYNQIHIDLRGFKISSNLISKINQSEVQIGNTPDRLIHSHATQDYDQGDISGKYLTNIKSLVTVLSNQIIETSEMHNPSGDPSVDQMLIKDSAVILNGNSVLLNPDGKIGSISNSVVFNSSNKISVDDKIIEVID